MNANEAQKAGFKFAKDHLAVIEAAHGTDIASAYANGHAWAARDYVFGIKGARGSFDMCFELAEGALTPVLPR